MAEKPKIGIIGKGDVGTNLAKGLTTAGYEVDEAGSDRSKVHQVAKDSDVIIMAVPHDETQNVLDECQGAHEGKILVDVTNVLSEDFKFAGSMQKSQAEKLQSLAPESVVAKAFNTVFAPTMSTGRANGDRLSVFVACDDDESRKRVMTLAQDIGFDAVDSGSLQNARYLEPLGYLNIQLGMKHGEEGADVGFKLVHP